MPNIPAALIPPPQYAEMARANIQNGQGILEYLAACEACGLPVEDRRAEVNEHITFAQAFLKNFYADAAEH